MTQRWTPVLRPGRWMNPVAAEALRHAARSRWVRAVLLLFLSANLLLLWLSQTHFDHVEPPWTDVLRMFEGGLALLWLACVGFAPVSAGIRLAWERRSTDSNRYVGATVTPGAIVRGKYLAATALALLIFSTTVPFTMFLYLLRDRTVPAVVVLVMGGFLLCAAANAMGLLAGAVSDNWFVGVAVITGIVLVLFVTIAEFFYVVDGEALSWYGLSTWRGAATFLFVWGLGIGALCVFAAAALSPRAWNRMMIPRLYMTGCWAVTGCIALLWSHANRDMRSVVTWGAWSVAAASVLVVAALGERDAWRVRVRRTIPRNPLARLGAFLGYTGSAGGVLWYTLLFAATLRIIDAWMDIGPGYRATATLARLPLNGLLGFGYILCLCLTVAALRPFFFRRVPTRYLSVFVAAMVPGAMLIASSFPHDGTLASLHWLWRWGGWYSPGRGLLGLALELHAFERRIDGIVLGWLALSTLAAVPWALGQWRRFTPYRSEAGGGPT